MEEDRKSRGLEPPLLQVGGGSAWGGGEKLFKAAVAWCRKEGYSRILSWSDACKSDGRVYERLGFKEAREATPDYFYSNGNGRTANKISRRKTEEQKKTGMTELELARQEGLFRVWDCGKTRWEYAL